MTQPFTKQIRLKLADANLQAALDGNAERRNHVRQASLDQLPDFPIRRIQAHEVRADVIAHLDAYLEQFTQRLSANGVHIHRAPDAAAAVQIVLDIAGQHQARLLAKSKSMVSEELRLNQALEGAGLKVVETDLGEYIVQLRGEAPAHIITPAVHLRREDVGQTFHEKLGVPYTDDIPTMTRLARRVLREVFLTADIGISGVNFGVVENGMLCVLTNEGNGRMVTTVPPVHIALMGIERMLPSLEDLALMLSLLPRSATGQKMTVYASLLFGPRRPQDPDGPQERHLVLLDNGRTALRGTPLEEALCCIRCGACLNACPVFRELGGHAYVGKHGGGSPYPGPIGSVLSPALFGQQEFCHLARASSLCGACREACPVDIDLPRLLLRVRAGGAHPQPNRLPPGIPAGLGLGLHLFRWAAVSPRRFHLAQRALGMFSRLLSPIAPWMRLPAFTGWGYSKDFPRPPFTPFHARWRALANEPVGASPTPPPALGAPPQKMAPRFEQVPAPDARLLSLQFEKELTALGGRLVRCTLAELPYKVLDELVARSIQQVMCWDEANLPAGLRTVMVQAGWRLLDVPSPTCQAGLTGALAAAAETGTLALTGGPGRMLSASLLPQVHLAVLQEDQIVPTLAELLALPALHQQAAAALVTGPSRTADIEMTLTIGVHGPEELVVFLVSA
jgi:L-lactate dehydrogenase complex protein LldF